MKNLVKRKKVRQYLALLSSLFLFGAIPYFAGSGLDNPEPLDGYLNNNFPTSFSVGLRYDPVFPNLTFDSPLTFNEVPDSDKIIVGQRDGQIFWFDNQPNVTAKNVLLDLSDKVGVVWDGGFLGMTLHPEFGTDGHNFFYTFYTTEDENSTDYPNFYTTQSCTNEEYWGNFLVLSRYEMDPITLEVQETSEQILLKLRMYGTTHRGGGLLFGDDGFLYLTTGDQTAFRKAQDITNNLDGGVLRLDVDMDTTKSHAPVRTMPNNHGFSDEISGNGYWIPNDNPFLSPLGETFEEYYSIGHRNPHRMTKDRATGELYVGEIGGGRHEEINIVKKGKNYGWPLYEGLHRNTSCVPELLNDMAHEEPLTFFPRSEANSVIGGYVYRGSEIPELQGKYICADYGVGEEIWTIDINTGSYEQLGSFASTDIISFGENQDGELYILKLGVSTLYKMVSKDNPFDAIPSLLSETGAFQNLSTLEPTDGLIPYDLVESFWSDGAIKKRWVGIPNDGAHDTPAEKISYSENDIWNFPIGSVLVKHFELPTDENNPATTKRLETRFSIKAEDGNFYFATYKWNDQQTDAELLTTGLDETINITRADGSTDTQVWQYPSNSDCTSCHNSASGGTLGTRTRYLNKEYTYPKTGRTANQLVTLSHLGILDQVITDADTATLLTYTSIDDTSASLDEKARSYLDLNCAYCHRPGTGNRSDFDLRMTLDIAQTGLLTANPIETLGIPNAKIVDEGNTDTSILYHRMNSVDPAVRMPLVAKNKIDERAVQLIDDWISQLTNPCSDRIIMETYTNVSGTSVAALKNDANYPNNPAQIDELYEFSIPVNAADSYGARVKGILRAPETGTYYFWVSGDDNVELNLSSDVNEANKTRIAYHTSWSNFEQWNKFPTQKSAGIQLVAGQNYYIEALMNEGTGGDNLSVGWRRPGEGDGSEPTEIIPCTVFDFFNGPPTVNVTGITIDNDSLTVQVDETTTLIATVAPSDASDSSIVWDSNDSLVATVDTDGLVTGISVGVATVTATTVDGGFTATSLVTVEAVTVAVTGVGLDTGSLSLDVGAERALLATVAPADAGDTSLTWSSDDESVATVAPDGTVTGVAQGSANITATTNDGGFTATAQVDVQVPDCTDRIVMETFGNVPGATIDELKASPDYPNSPSQVGQLDEFSIPVNAGSNYGARVKGILRAPETGNYYFWVSGNDNVELNLSTDGDRANAARIAYHNGWSAFRQWDKFATQKSGAVQLVAGQNYYIEALVNESGGGDNLSVGWRRPSDGDGNEPFEVLRCSAFEPLPSVAVTGVGLDTGSLSLDVGAERALLATVAPADAGDTSLTWSSDDESVATVAPDGTVTGVAQGSANITATTNDGGFTATAQVDVQVPDCTDRIVMETFGNVPGATIDELKASPDYPNSPSQVGQLDEFSIPVNAGSNYGARVKGILRAPETGNYYFWVSGNDNVELNLSTDGDRANAARIAYHNGWSAFRQWDKFATQKSGAVQLVAGQNYYIEALVNESGGGDNLSVGWRRPSDGDGNEPFEVLRCSAFEPLPSVAVTGVGLDTGSLSLDVGAERALLATVAPADAGDTSLTWSSDDESVATVAPDGTVTGVAQGSANITATTNDGGFTATAQVDVQVPDCTDRIVMETFGNVPGATIDELKASPDYPNSPSQVGQLDEFSIPVNAGSNYGARVKGILRAPETGNYYFWVSGNDNVELNLSTDGDRANAARIAYHNGWSAFRQWNKFATQKSGAVQLVAGQNYYIEALVNESGGGDNLSVGWRRPSDGDGNEPFEVLRCSAFEPLPSVAVTGVGLDTGSLSLDVGAERALLATVAPADAGDTSLTWSSDDESVATVAPDGTVTGVAQGSANITATTNDGGFTATAQVDVQVPDCTDRIVMETFGNVPGATIDELKASPDYPNSPSQVGQLDEFSIPVNAGSNYGARVKGILRAPETGNYYFWVSGNDNVELNLSTDGDRANAARIAYHNGWSAFRQWDKFATQKSGAVQLVAGQNYYIEALVNESGGGDNLSVGWRRPSDGDGNEPFEVLRCSAFEPLPSVAVTGVGLDTGSLSLDVGAERALLATVAPADAGDTSLTWSSDDESVATVAPDGTVTGVAQGSANITATTNDGGFTATAQVDVQVPDCTDRIVMETFGNVPGATIDELKASPDYPNSPSQVGQLDEFSIPVNAGSNYGARVKGILRAPETGNYYFWVSGNDNVELNLSTDGDRANAARIAYHNGWSAFRQWDKFATQKSGAVQLVAGQNYYIEALVNESGGGDNLSVGWRRPSDGDGNEPFEVLRCSAFEPLPSVAVTGVGLDTGSLSLDVGAERALLATVAPADAGDTSLTWSSDDESVATVAPDGTVTGVAQGSANITATTNDGGFTATAQVDVQVPTVAVTTVSVSPNSGTLVTGSVLQLVVTVFPSDASDPSVIWASDDTAVATVDGSGLVTAISEGGSNITATTNDGGFIATAIVTVESGNVAVTGVALAPDTVTITEGDTQQLTSEVSPANATDPSVTWTSGDTAVATVDSSGLVTAISEGSTNVTVTTNDGGFMDDTLITVETANIAVTGVSVSPESGTLMEGSAIQLTATLFPADATDSSVQWTSDNTNVATVDVSGLVNAISLGTVTINATTTDGGFTAIATVTVEAANIAVTGIGLTPNTIMITEGDTQQIAADVSPVDASDPSVSWASDDASVAMVGPNGTVTGISEGITNITATTNDGGFIATAIVNVESANVAVTGVALAPDTVTITKGDTQQLVATVSPMDASDQSIQWTSDDENIVTVDSDGLVTAVAPGTATITATTNDGGFNVSSIITVESPEPTAKTSNIPNSEESINPEVPAMVLNLSIYPNPASEVLNIEVPKNQILRKIYVYDESSRTVLEESGKDVLLSLNKYQIKTHGLLPGIYILHIITEDGLQLSQKFIKN